MRKASTGSRRWRRARTKLNATLSGFNPAKVPDVRLVLGQILKAEIIMAVAGLSEEVTVLSETPLVDVKQNAVTTTITSEVIDLIPKGRNYLAGHQRRRRAPASRRAAA